jgi:uncharacterized repeat protein (TIGR01451 family)
MRIGIKFVAITGLCGLALSCLMGLAEDGPAPESGPDFLILPPKQTEPDDQPPAKYSRNRDNQPVVEDFLPAPPGEQFTPAVPSAGSQPFFPLGNALPTAPAEETNDALLRAQYLEPGHSSQQPPRVQIQEIMPAEPDAAGPGSATLFAGDPVPAPTANVTVFNEGDSAPMVGNVTVTPLLPAAPKSEPLPEEIPVEPTAGPQSAALTLEWVKRTEVNVGQECQCDLVVKNTGKTVARNISVRATLPASARLLASTTPTPTAQAHQLHWQLGDLEPEQTKTIQIHIIPTSRGDLTASAVVHFISAAATAFRVQEPLLEVVLQGPKEVQIGDPASQIIQVSNPGTGTARNVEIKALIPPGLEHPQGKQLTMAIGSLNPGETRMVRLALSAVSGGKQQIKVLAEAKLSPEAAPYLRKLSETDIQIISPSVKVGVDGPALRYKHRNATYEITATNDGTAVSNNVRVMHKVPEGFQFVSATQGGKFDAVSKTVGWFVGRIEPGQSSAMSVTLEAVQLGDFEHEVSAMTDQGARSEDVLPTRVEGIASLVLEVNDLNDPVEVGVETAYEVHVKNHGTKHAQNVAVACELPAGVDLVDVKAPAPYSLQGRVVVFQNLSTLDPEKTATYRIIVRGNADGDHRFRARLASDSIQEPLLVEELTKSYGE